MLFYTFYYMQQFICHIVSLINISNDFTIQLLKDPS